MTFRRVPCPPSPSYCRICHRYHDPTPPPESLRSPFEALRAPEPESDPTDLSGVMQAVGVAVPAVTGLLQGIAESRERRIQDRVAAEALCARVEACTLMVTHLGKAGASATAISEAVTEALSTACETFRAVREEAEEDDDDVQAASPASDLEDLLGQPTEVRRVRQEDLERFIRDRMKTGQIPEPKKA